MSAPFPERRSLPLLVAVVEVPTEGAVSITITDEDMAASPLVSAVLRGLGAADRPGRSAMKT